MQLSTSQYVTIDAQSTVLTLTHVMLKKLLFIFLPPRLPRIACVRPFGCAQTTRAVLLDARKRRVRNKVVCGNFVLVFFLV